MRRQFGKDNDQLFDKDLPLPSELSWENMEDGIFAKMAAKQPFYKRPLFRWTGLILVLGMLAWLALGDNPSWQEQQELAAEDSKPLSTESAIDEVVVQSATNTSRQTPIKEQSDGTNLTAKAWPKTAMTTNQDKEVLPTDLAPKIKVTNVLNLETDQLISTTQKVLSTQQEPQPKEVGTVESATKSATSQQPTKDQFTLSTAGQAPTLKLKAEPTLEMRRVYNVSQGIQTYNIPTTITTSAANPPEREISFRTSRKPWRLLIQTGFNAFNSQYDGANAEITRLRSSSEFFDPGTQLEIRVEKRFRENWFFGTGIGLHTYRRRLDVQATANIQRLYTDVLISYNEDPTTGEISNEIFADTMLNVSQLRKIKHFNRYQSWEIPIYLGYQQQYERWNYAATFGLTASVKREIDGRVFDQDGEVGTLGQETFLPYDTEVSAAYQLEGRIGYRLLPSLDIHASLGRQNFIGNWMANSNNALTSRPGIWRLSFGTSVLF